MSSKDLEDKTQLKNIQKAEKNEFENTEQNTEKIPVIARLSTELSEMADLQIAEKKEMKFDFANAPKLGSENYTIWKWQFKNILKVKGLAKLVSSDAEFEVKRPTVEEDAKGLAILGSTLSDENLMKIVNCEDFRSAWKTLEMCYENKTSFEPQALYSRLHGYRIKSVKDVSKGISEIQDIVNKLKNLNEQLSEAAIMGAIVAALPPQFKTFVAIWRNTSAGQGVDHLIAKIMSEAHMLDSEDTSRDTKAYAAKDKVEKSKGKQSSSNKKVGQDKSKTVLKDGTVIDKNACRYCRENGHWVNDCPKLKAKLEREGQNKKEVENPEPSQEKGAKVEIDFAKVANSNGKYSQKSNRFIADSGATSHMSPRREWFTDYKKFEEPLYVEIADGTALKCVGRGSIQTTAGLIGVAIHVPELTDSLLSMNTLANNGIVFVGKGSEIVFYDKDMDELFKAKIASDKQYVCDFEIVLAKANKASVMGWHERFGHLSVDKILHMAKHEVVDGLKIDGADKEECETCLVSKTQKCPHPPRGTPRTDTAGASLHFDTVGPINPASLGGSKYICLMKDEATGYRLVEFVATKDLIKYKVMRMINQAELETGNKTLKIVTDNGSEFVNSDLNEFLETRGILHARSVRYSAQQNGYIENDIKTITRAARAMLVGANMNKNFWAEAMSCAVYVMNRSSTSRNPHQSCFELWFGYRPNVQNLRVFGQQAIVLREKAGSKFDAKADRYTFLGYGDRSNTYRLFRNGKIYIECNVRFLESRTTHQVEPKLKTTQNDSERVTLSLAYDDDSWDETSTEGSDDETEIEDVDSEQAATSAGATTSRNETGDEESLQFEFQGRNYIAHPANDELIAGGSSSQKSPLKTIARSSRQTIGRIVREGILGAPRKTPVGYHNVRGPDGRFVKRSDKASLARSIIEPANFREAMSSEDRSEWLKAMQEELDSLTQHEVYEVSVNPGSRVVSSKWVYRVKPNPDNQTVKFKARLVARGFSQLPGIDFTDTYSPVANHVSIRMLLAMAAIRNYEILQFDVKTAFLYGSLSEQIFMKIPEGVKHNENEVWRLKRSLYGLRQSPRNWNRRFTEFLEKQGLEQSRHDHCVYFSTKVELYLTIYVDDGLILVKERKFGEELIEAIKSEFEISQVKPSKYLGFQLEYGDGKIQLHQQLYALRVLSRFKMDSCKPAATPMALDYDKRRQNSSKLKSNDEYMQAVGSLLYLAINTRPDILFAVTKVSKYCSEPTEEDWTACKRILRYVAGTVKFGVEYSSTGNANPIVYTDSDYAGDLDSGRSTSGSVVVIASGPVSWKSKRQALVTLSSTEAEYVALCTATKEAVWLRSFGKELSLFKEQITVYCDNTSTIKLASNEKSMMRTRHLAAQEAFSRERQLFKEVNFKHICSAQQKADLLTKALATEKFITNRDNLMQEF